MIRLASLAIGIGLLASLTPSVTADAPAGSKRPAVLDVQLPADAGLEIDGKLTSTKGGKRLFQSPPLTGGKIYVYTIKVSWQGKEAVRTIDVKPGETTSVTFSEQDFVAAVPARPVEPAPIPAPPEKKTVAKEEQAPAPAEKKAAAKEEPAPAPAPAAKALPARAGFVLIEQDGRWWIFREGSKELQEFKKVGEPDKHVTRLNAAPYQATFKAPDVATLEEYLCAKAGFIVRYEDGRLWVFAVGSKELEDFQKYGELAKHVTRINAGPRGLTLKGPDYDTLDAYLKAGSN